MDPKDRKARKTEQPVPPGIYPVIDTDLARDNIENDLPAADLEDLLQGGAQAQHSGYSIREGEAHGKPIER